MSAEQTARKLESPHATPPTQGSGPRLVAALDRPFQFVSRIAGEVATAAFVALLVLATFSVFMRNVFNLSYAWMDELLRYLLIWSVFMGVVSLSRKNDHIAMDAILRILPGAIQRFLQWLITTTIILVSGYLVTLGWDTVALSIQTGEVSPSGVLPAWVAYSALPLGFALVAVASVAALLRQYRAGRAQLPDDHAQSQQEVIRRDDDDSHHGRGV